jgi:hypothetical protein
MAFPTRPCSRAFMSFFSRQDTGHGTPNHTSAPKSDQHPPRHIREVPKVNIASVPLYWRSRDNGPVQPGWFKSLSGKSSGKTPQSSSRSEIRKTKAPTLSNILQGVCQLQQLTFPVRGKGLWSFHSTWGGGQHSQESRPGQYQHRSTIRMQAVHSVLHHAESSGQVPAAANSVSVRPCLLL